MTISLPRWIFACTFSLMTGVSSAVASECLNAGKTRIGNAIGVMLYEKVVREYESDVLIEDIVAGLMHASNQQGFASFPEITDISHGGEQTERKMSGSDAQRAINDWRAGAETVDERFLQAYKRRTDTREEPSGLLWRKLTKQINAESLERCMANAFESQEEKDKQLCYVRLSLDEAAVCSVADAGPNESLHTSELNMTFGRYDKDEVIPGWAEAFDLLDSQADESSDAVYLEIVTPPELAYGTKGLPGRVESDETLWFILAVKKIDSD